MYTLLRLLNIDISPFEVRLLWALILVIFLIYRAQNFYRRYSTFTSTMYSYEAPPTNDIDTIKKSIYTNKFSDKVVVFFRRNRALKKCKKFTTKTNYLIRLKNQYINISYLTEKKIITCQELSKTKRILTIDWKESSENDFEYYSVNNIFEKMFDNICLAFNEKTTYDNVAPILKNYFKTKEEITNPQQQEKIQNTVEEEKEIKKIEIKKIQNTIVDINSASEEELTKLAGITIVKAKQIVKYRDLHKGFKSKEEFFEQMKIKKHFRKQQYEYIVLSEYKIEEECVEERILDF